ncbi:helix-turn-helix domain-containing protein [Streptomyces sp. SCSIO ZS0520]|uniref:helix-turn-helix domain-containing protein n=1 Tax=Streptomyces sp. SCSIO ZS0520 TaxID=2892996 RepID=UPI0021DB2DAD|nr:helix-turn-helix transcriptional regulator [Streptomyces sp. SCSIO ZS0520]
MSNRPRPTVRRRKLGGELRRLREAAGVSLEQAAERIGGEKSKISRQETGRQGVRKLELEALFELYSVTDERLKTALTTLSRESRRKNWWAPYGEILGEEFQERLSIESEAVRTQLFQPLLVPGPLQTRAYAEVLIRGAARDTDAGHIESLIDLRTERQKVLQEKKSQVLCLLDEAVLRRAIGGPEVMREQLQKLLDVNNPPMLSIQIVPFGQGWHAGLDGPFGIFSYPDPMDLDVVSIEYLDGVRYLEENEPVERYKLAFDQLRASALPSKQSMDLITQVMRDLKKT